MRVSALTSAPFRWQTQISVSAKFWSLPKAGWCSTVALLLLAGWVKYFGLFSFYVVETQNLEARYVNFSSRASTPPEQEGGQQLEWLASGLMNTSERVVGFFCSSCLEDQQALVKQSSSSGYSCTAGVSKARLFLTSCCILPFYQQGAVHSWSFKREREITLSIPSSLKIKKIGFFFF